MDFKHAAIHIGIATSAFTFGSGALAQNINTTPTTEEVLVTGIRSSLQHAIDLKRNSDEIVDSIASESVIPWACGQSFMECRRSRKSAVIGFLSSRKI